MESIQDRLKAIIDIPELPAWTYGAYWQHTVDVQTGQPVLVWGDGYFLGEQPNSSKTKTTSCDQAEQEHRKRVLRELNSLLSGAPNCEDGSGSGSGSVDEVVSDTEWFFLVSMTLSFSIGEDFPGEVYRRGEPVWVTGSGQLGSWAWSRAKKGAGYGLESMVCVPVPGGVVEFGSTEVIGQSEELVRKVVSFFGTGVRDCGLVTIPIGTSIQSSM